MEQLWLGIDAGTTAIKAGIYRPDGTCVSTGACPSPVITPQPGQSQQDMAQVWDGVCTAIRAALEGVDASRIASIGIAAQGDGLWALDEAGTPVGPAILWNDTRAAPVLEGLSAAQQSVINRTCNTSLWPGTSGTIFRWLMEAAPEQVARVRYVMHCAGWVGYCLTGEMAVDHSDATIPFLDLNSRTYSTDAMAALGVGQIEQALLPVRSAETRLGGISADAAALTGLIADTPVSVGTLDLSAMIVGMGMDQPGDTMMILGTTAVINILTDRIAPSDAPVGATVLHANGQVMTRVLAPTTGAAAFDWFCALHPQTLGGETPAEIAAKLNALAEAVPPGSNGVTFLPYLNGERAPFVEPEASGAFFGLKATSTKADMGRAVMEGAAFSLRHCYLAERGHLPRTPIRLTGGGAKNALWCQIIADVMQTPIQVSAASDHGLWGAACLGAAATGKGKACALAQRAEETVTYDPDPETAQPYDHAFIRYAALSEACQTLWAQQKGKDLT
ncbi:xylulokinase [Ruegeria jejuensis]|uniref:xylulokinase n=1 Tax=Ruegeria jejuensis TaxID=3233338 RepID=UPI00355B8DFB